MVLYHAFMLSTVYQTLFKTDWQMRHIHQIIYAFMFFNVIANCMYGVANTQIG